MTWEEALSEILKRPNHQRFEKLCSEEHKDHLLWRQEVIKMMEDPEKNIISPPAITKKSTILPRKPCNCGKKSTLTEEEKKKLMERRQHILQVNQARLQVNQARLKAIKEKFK